MRYYFKNILKSMCSQVAPGLTMITTLPSLAAASRVSVTPARVVESQGVNLTTEQLRFGVFGCDDRDHHIRGFRRAAEPVGMCLEHHLLALDPFLDHVWAEAPWRLGGLWQGQVLFGLNFTQRAPIRQDAVSGEDREVGQVEVERVLLARHSRAGEDQAVEGHAGGLIAGGEGGGARTLCRI